MKVTWQLQTGVSSHVNGRVLWPQTHSTVGASTYFQAVTSVLGDGGQAYRLSGGADEVMVVLPNRDEQAAVQIVQLACTKLMNERLWPTDPTALLSIAVGVIAITDPTTSPTRLRSAADEEQKKAKLRCKQAVPPPSVIAIKGKDELVVIEHDSSD